MYFIGAQGLIMRQLTTEQLLDWLEHSHATMAEMPLVDLVHVFTGCTFIFNKDTDDEVLKEDSQRIEDVELEVFVAGFYRSLGKYSRYGEIIRVQRIQVSVELDHVKFAYVINFIGRLAVKKPLLAADVLPVIIDGQGNRYAIMIKRKNDPGAGKLALVGGCRDVIDTHYETGMEAGVRETLEEISLRINVRDSDEYRLCQVPNYPEVVASVTLADGILAMGRLILIGTFQTGDEEIYEALNERRIHETTAYMLVVRCSEALSLEQIMASVMAQDDALEIVIQQIFFSPTSKALDFGMSHHATIYNTAIKMLSEVCL